MTDKPSSTLFLLSLVIWSILTGMHNGFTESVKMSRSNFTPGVPSDWGHGGCRHCPLSGRSSGFSSTRFEPRIESGLDNVDGLGYLNGPQGPSGCFWVPSAEEKRCMSRVGR